jgi:hypothetical protein
MFLISFMRSVSIKQEKFTKRQSMEVHWAWNVDTEQKKRRQKVYSLFYLHGAFSLGEVQ